MLLQSCLALPGPAGWPETDQLFWELPIYEVGTPHPTQELWGTDVAGKGGYEWECHFYLRGLAAECLGWGSAVSLGPLPSWAPVSALPKWIGVSALGGCSGVGRQGKAPSSKILRGVVPHPSDPAWKARVVPPPLLSQGCRGCLRVWGRGHMCGGGQMQASVPPISCLPFKGPQALCSCWGSCLPWLCDLGQVPRLHPCSCNEAYAFGLCSS